MSRHNLCSPSRTYYVLPPMEVLNKGTQCRAPPLHLKNPVVLENIPRIINSQNNSRFQGMENARFNVIRRNNKNATSGTTQTNHIRESENETRNNEEATFNITRNGRQNNRFAPIEFGTRQIPSNSRQGVTSKEKTTNTKQNSIPSRITQQKQKGKTYLLESDSDSSSSNDFSVEPKSSLEPLRLPYNSKEDIEILRFVLKDDNIERTGSLSLWKELEKIKSQPRRTYQSLKNRFLRNIKPHMLTKYRNLLDAESARKVKKRFPDLKKHSSLKQIVTEENVQRKQHITPSPEPIAGPSRINAATQMTRMKTPWTREVETNTTSFGQQALEKEAEPIVTSPPPPVGSPTREDVFAERSSDQQETSTAVELYVPRTEASFPVQSYQCTKIVKSFKNKTNLNLNIVLLNDQTSSILSKLNGPVKVDVVVSFSPVKGNANPENNLQRTKQIKEITSPKPQSPPPAKKKEKKRRKKRPPQDGWQCRYVLQLKKSNLQKLTKLPESYKMTVADLLQKIGRNSKKNLRSIDQNSLSGMRLRSQSRRQPVADGQSNCVSTQETNCSIEDDSDYSQVYREVVEKYQIVSEPQNEVVNDKMGNSNLQHREKMNPYNGNILLKNMVGMLSPSSKVFSNGAAAHGKPFSKRL